MPGSSRAQTSRTLLPVAPGLAKRGVKAAEMPIVLVLIVRPVPQTPKSSAVRLVWSGAAVRQFDAPVVDAPANRGLTSRQNGFVDSVAARRGRSRNENPVELAHVDKKGVSAVCMSSRDGQERRSPGRRCVWPLRSAFCCVRPPRRSSPAAHCSPRLSL